MSKARWQKMQEKGEQSRLRQASPGVVLRLPDSYSESAKELADLARCQFDRQMTQAAVPDTRQYRVKTRTKDGRVDRFTFKRVHRSDSHLTRPNVDGLVHGEKSPMDSAIHYGTESRKKNPAGYRSAEEWEKERLDHQALLDRLFSAGFGEWAIRRYFGDHRPIPEAIRDSVKAEVARIEEFLAG